MTATCRVTGCTADSKVNHHVLHSATNEQLASTPAHWVSYAQNRAELARRSAL